MFSPRVILALNLLAGTITLSCGSKTAANKSNFKGAIQAELDRSPVCIVANLPTEIPGWNGQIRGNAQLDVLVNVGLVKRSEAMVRRDAMEMAFGGAKPVQGYRYEISDSGKKYVAQLPTMGGSYSHLCYGNKKVVDIVRYTEPSPAMGMTVSQVTYTWRLQDVADWAKNPGVEKAYSTGSTLAAAETPQEAAMALVLSNDGWHAPH